jgi:hypothetical protein
LALAASLAFSRSQRNTGDEMKLNLRNAVWVFGLAIALMVTMTPKLAVAQSEQGMEHGKGHNKNKWNRNTDNADYQRGVREGQDDRSNRRNHQYRSRNDNDGDRSAYQAGYDAGYRNANGGQYNGNGQYGNGQYNGNNNGQYGRNNGNVASQMGAQDGVNDGRQDRQTGHSNRPTKGDNYKNALRGYNSSFGGENQYKAMYRQAYVPAYQQGYNNNQGVYRRQ